MSSYARYSSVFTQNTPDMGVGTLVYSKNMSNPKANHPKRKHAVLPLLKPVAIFLLAAALAFGHHIFNVFADLKSLNAIPIPQEWINRVGTAFAVGFQTSLSVSLSFVLCQIMWVTLKGRLLKLSEIDNIYLSAGRNVLATYCSSTLHKSPLLVLTVSISFLLAIPTVLTPSSLRVVPHTLVNPSMPCQIPTGDLTKAGILYSAGGAGYWTGITPVAQKLAYSTFVGQKIPSLPHPTVCGLSCSYAVSVPSFAFQCKEISDAELPSGMYTPYDPDALYPGVETFWNITVNSTDDIPAPEAAFWVYWHSSTKSGTSGSALCTVETATYDFNVQITNGTQSIGYNVTQTGDLPDSYVNMEAGHERVNQDFLLRLSSISWAARSLLVGSVSTLHGASSDTSLFNSPVISAAFFNSSLNGGEELTWEDVPRGIEELSHNVSAAILTMDLGLRNASCVVRSQEIVYEYDRLNLWVPYGVALLVLLVCLVIGISLFLKHNPGDLTPSFSHTVTLTRNPSLNLVAWDDNDIVEKQTLRFSLGELKDGSTGFGLQGDLKSR